MSAATTSLIHRQVVDIALKGSESDGFFFQQRVGGIMTDRVVPAIDRILKKFDPGDEHWIIGRLELDLGTFAMADLENKLPDAIAGAMQSLLEGHTGIGGNAAERARRQTGDPNFLDHANRQKLDENRGFVRHTRGQGIAAAFMHFLATGVLPWWFQLAGGRTLAAEVQAMLEDDHAISIVQAVAKRPLTAVEITRLTRQFSPLLHATLLKHFAPDAAGEVTHFLDGIINDAEKTGKHVAEAARNLRPALETILWRAAVALAMRRQAVSETALARAWQSELAELPDEDAGQVAALIKRLRPSNAEFEPAVTSDAPSGKGEAQGPPELPDGEFGLPVTCAGIVLLHPFLPQLFASLSVAEDGRIVQSDRALALLHFLATGESEAAEHELLLPKLLCGMAAEEIAPVPVQLSEHDQDEALGLLKAVVGHWSALGNASVDSLRGTFLVRNGLLRQRNDGEHELQVEPASFDILLDGLPWGFGAIRLPWMNKMLWVEWNR